MRRDGELLALGHERCPRLIRQLELAADVRHAGDRADDEQRKPDAPGAPRVAEICSSFTLNELIMCTI